MGYPYTWQIPINGGITGPRPPTMEITSSDNVLEKKEVFYTGFSDSEYKKLIRASLQRILMTEKGERVMLPEFGCDLNKYIFEPRDRILEVEIKAEIMQAIEKWEPRITIKSIDINFVNGNALVISIPYIINGTDLSDTINYVIKANG